ADAGGAALHAERRSERGVAQTQPRPFANMVQRVGETHSGGGLALARGCRRDGGDQDQLPVRAILERLDEVHRELGLVVAIGLKAFRRDAELLARNVHDRPLLGGLRDLDVGLRVGVLRGTHRSFHGGCRRRSHVSLVPVESLELVANSPAASLGPSACTRRSLKRPSAHTTVTPSASTATISPILPAMPLGSLAGNGFASKIFKVL